MKRRLEKSVKRTKTIVVEGESYYELHLLFITDVLVDIVVLTALSMFIIVSRPS